MAITSALLPVAGGYAQESRAAAESIGAQRTIEVSPVTKTWKVTAVDPANRTVTVTSDTGKSNTYKLGDAVSNLDQIKAGDEIKGTLLQSVAVAIRKLNASPSDAGEPTTFAVAPKGATPSVIMTKQVTATIVSVDTKARTVSVVGPEGGEQVIQVGPEVKLDGYQTGDEVTLRVTVGLVVRVEKP
jgi:hypothetical protein